MKNTMKILYFFLAIICYHHCMVYEKCELAETLVKKYGFNRNLIPDWVCIAFYGSSYDTMALNRPYQAASSRYGIFQINSTWCASTGSVVRSVCKVKCDDLRSNDITKSVKCGKKIYLRKKFNAWREWNVYCQRGEAKKLVADCEY